MVFVRIQMRFKLCAEGSSCSSCSACASNETVTFGRQGPAHDIQTHQSPSRARFATLAPCLAESPACLLACRAATPHEVRARALNHQCHASTNGVGATSEAIKNRHGNWRCVCDLRLLRNASNSAIFSAQTPWTGTTPASAVPAAPVQLGARCECPACVVPSAHPRLPRLRKGASHNLPEAQFPPITAVSHFIVGLGSPLSRQSHLLYLNDAVIGSARHFLAIGAVTNHNPARICLGFERNITTVTPP